MSHRRGATELLDLVLDDRSFVSWDREIDLSGHSETYRAVLEEAALKAGTDESVLTGRGLVHGRPVAVIVNEFRFLAGSIGRDAAARIISAVRRATAERLPILAATASGGTRMQEGTPAFVQMVEISRALMAHRTSGLPYLVYLRHPTTGGVFASWGSLAHVTVAEPGALIGFLGPKVYEALTGTQFLPGVQTAENLAAHGVIDAVVPAEDLPMLVDRALHVLVDAPAPTQMSRRPGMTESSRPAWTSIARTRKGDRAGVRELVRYGCDGSLRLAGTKKGERDASILTVLTRVDGQPCILVGQDRSRQSPTSGLGPAALREACRAMGLAEELRIPLVTVIDSPGADLSQRAEEGALAGEIARCIARMTTLTVPTLSVILGQGCGGAALALLPARLRIAAENGWLSPLPPEGASFIMHGDVEHAADVAAAQKVRAVDLLASGSIHRVIPEYENDSPVDLSVAVAAEIAAGLQAMPIQSKVLCK